MKKECECKIKRPLFMNLTKSWRKTKYVMCSEEGCEKIFLKESGEVNVNE